MFLQLLLILMIIKMSETTHNRMYVLDVLSHSHWAATPVRPSTIYTVCPILECVEYCHHRIHYKDIPPNAICIALSSIGSWIPATEPHWQIKYALTGNDPMSPAFQADMLTTTLHHPSVDSTKTALSQSLRRWKVFFFKVKLA